MKTLAELTAPAAIERKPLLEAEVQDQCVKWARARGYWARKFSSKSQRSVPDYLFSRREYMDFVYADSRCYKEIKFATEFKRADAKVNKKTGCMSTEAQVEEQELMRQAGWHVFECNDFERFKHAVLAYEKENGIV